MGKGLVKKMIQQERLVQTVLDLVQLDSESKQERAVADYVTARLTALGYTVKEDNAGESFGGNAGNVIAYKAGTGAGKCLLFWRPYGYGETGERCQANCGAGHYPQ